MEEELRQRQVAALGVLVYVGAEESRQLRAEQWNAHCTYLTHPERALTDRKRCKKNGVLNLNRAERT